MDDNWVVVVDDDAITLKNAFNMLSEQNIRVSCVESGKELITFMKNNAPDLILLDVLMPGQDGFETYRKLRELEEEEGRNQTPVIFMTADEESETERIGLEIGAADFIRKPFNKDSLLLRIHNVVIKNKKIETLTEEVSVDKLTGLLNKGAADETMHEVCQEESGIMAFIDLDNFKLINDIYGHDMGDKVLSSFADILRSNTRTEDILCRIGGDEFLAFFRNLLEENVVIGLTKRLNNHLLNKCRELMGEDFDIDIGVSVGCVAVSEQERDYDVLFQTADKALFYVKKNGKHSCQLYSPDECLEFDGKEDLKKELSRITQIVEERGEILDALWVNQEAFTWGYRFMTRFMKRCKGKIIKLLFSVSLPDGEDESILSDAIEHLGLIIQKNLRKSDLMMQDKKNHFFLLLPEVSGDDVDAVINRVMEAWNDDVYHDRIIINHIKEYIDYSMER